MTTPLEIKQAAVNFARADHAAWTAETDKAGTDFTDASDKVLFENPQPLTLPVGALRFDNKTAQTWIAGNAEVNAEFSKLDAEGKEQALNYVNVSLQTRAAKDMLQALPAGKEMREEIDGRISADSKLNLLDIPGFDSKEYVNRVVNESKTVNTAINETTMARLNAVAEHVKPAFGSVRIMDTKAAVTQAENTAIAAVKDFGRITGVSRVIDALGTARANDKPVAAAPDVANKGPLSSTNEAKAKDKDQLFPAVDYAQNPPAKPQDIHAPMLNANVTDVAAADKAATVQQPAAGGGKQQLKIKGASVNVAAYQEMMNAYDKKAHGGQHQIAVDGAWQDQTTHLYKDLCKELGIADNDNGTKLINVLRSKENIVLNTGNFEVVSPKATPVTAIAATDAGKGK